MTEKMSLMKSVTIHCDASKVWQALIDPEMIRQYFFGVETKGSWQPGNIIHYKGEWQGKQFQSKAIVKKANKEKLLQYDYWSDMSGLPDQPENYHTITYKLSLQNNNTLLSLTEENLQDQTMKERSGKIWDMVFQNMK